MLPASTRSHVASPFTQPIWPGIAPRRTFSLSNNTLTPRVSQALGDVLPDTWQRRTAAKTGVTRRGWNNSELASVINGAGAS